jgi:hypothetical protein
MLQHFHLLPLTRLQKLGNPPPSYNSSSHPCHIDALASNLPRTFTITVSHLTIAVIYYLLRQPVRGELMTL